jgi:uncharacterized protein (TIGR02246 family)
MTETTGVTESTEALVRRLLDESEVRNRIARLAQATDDGTPEEYAEHWSEDAVWEVIGHESRSGRDDILAGARARHEAGLIGPSTNTRHIVATSVVEIDGDRATARSAHAVLIKDGGAVVGFSGVYEDELRREPNGWLISRRLVRPQ